MAIYQNTSKDIRLTYIGVSGVPQPIEGFGPDAIIVTDDVENVTITKGADGKTSAASTAVELTGTLTLAAGSPSIDAVINPILFTQTNTGYIAAGVLSMEIPALKKRVTFENVIFKNALTPGAAEATLSERNYTFSYDSIIEIPM